jgi:hypothetical protein
MFIPDLSAIGSLPKAGDYGGNVLSSSHEDFLFYDLVKEAWGLGVRLDFHVHAYDAEKDLMEPALLDLLDKQLASYEADPEIQTTLAHKDNKWRVTSSMQKAIRRGDKLNAKKAAHALLVTPSEYEYLWKRLVVIGVEDIGLGNLYLAAQLLAVSGKKAWRTERGDRKVLFLLIDKLCESVKSRWAPDLIGLLDWTHSSMDEVAWIAKQTPEELAQITLNRQWPLRLRGLALWTLAGTRKYPSLTLPERPGWPELLDQVAQGFECPPLLGWVVDKWSRRHRDFMACTLPFGWEMLCASQEVWLNQIDFGEPVLVQGVLSCAFDIHTQDGKRAMAYFGKACGPANAFLSLRPKLNRPEALGCAVFYAEGGKITPELAFDGLAEMMEVSFREVFGKFLMTWPEAEELMQIVRDNMPKLHAARAKVTTK